MEVFFGGITVAEAAARVEGLVIPVTVDDLAANGLLGEADQQVCWERSVETITARVKTLGFSPVGGHLLYAARARSA